PGIPQPSQRMFESRLFAAFGGFDAARPVFVEAESRRIGSLQLPDALLDMMRAAPSLCIYATVQARVEFLLRDYNYFLEDPHWLLERFGLLHGLQSNETLARWRSLVEAGEHQTLVNELLELHYDPLYQRSQTKNFAGFRNAARFATDDLSPAGILRLAQEILTHA
ncbi:MAG: tRNA 2-selenouridine(34) synthase MnmH, partial [Proteobacteria bacterium]|nr:tRNA 2-selenouridine(34) synthase MnmH [Pseudomonadota bacterium]